MTQENENLRLFLNMARVVGWVFFVGGVVWVFLAHAHVSSGKPVLVNGEISEAQWTKTLFVYGPLLHVSVGCCLALLPRRILRSAALRFFRRMAKRTGRRSKFEPTEP